MSFGGSVQAMITSLKNNSRKRKSGFENKPGSVGTGKTDAWTKFLEKEATADQLEEIRKQVSAENKKETRKRAFAILVSLVILGILAVCIVNLTK